MSAILPTVTVTNRLLPGVKADYVRATLAEMGTMKPLLGRNEILLDNPNIIPMHDDAIPSWGAVKTFASGLHPAEACLLATPDLEVLDATGTQNTLTASAPNVPLEIDGVTVPLGQRVLVRAGITGDADGANSVHNGLYSLTTEAAVGVEWVLTRTSDGSDPNLVSGTYVIISQGNTLRNSTFLLYTSNPIDVGVTPQHWVLFTMGGNVNYIPGTIPAAIGAVPVFGSATGQEIQAAPLTMTLAAQDAEIAPYNAATNVVMKATGKFEVRPTAAVIAGSMLSVAAPTGDATSVQGGTLTSECAFFSRGVNRYTQSISAAYINTAGAPAVIDLEGDYENPGDNLGRSFDVLLVQNDYAAADTTFTVKTLAHTTTTGGRGREFIILCKSSVDTATTTVTFVDETDTPIADVPDLVITGIGTKSAARYIVSDGLFQL